MPISKKVIISRPKKSKSYFGLNMSKAIKDWGGLNP